MRICAVLAASLLAACGGQTPAPEPRVIIQEVRVPVPTPCSVQVDPRPEFGDSKEELRGLPPDVQLRRFAGARELRGPYLDQIEGALAKCR